MKENYTILVPNMLPMHFRLHGAACCNNYGYNMELLRDRRSRRSSSTGLKYVHNDTCYPAMLVIGQFIDALQSRQVRPAQDRADPVRRPAAAAVPPTISTCCARRWKRAGYGVMCRSFR